MMDLVDISALASAESGMTTNKRARHWMTGGATWPDAWFEAKR